MTEDRWQELYINLVNEVDSSRLEQKVAEIEKAFQERLGEIDPQNDAEEYPLLRRTMESVNRLKNQNLRLATFPIMRSKQRESYRPAILVCTTVVDLDRKYVEVSDDFCRLLGYARQELIGMKYDELTAPNTNDIEAVFGMFKELGHMQGLWVLVHREGTRILVRYACRLRQDSLIEGKLESLGVGY